MLFRSPEWDAGEQAFVRVMSVGPTKNALVLRLDAETKHTFAPSANSRVVRIVISGGKVRVDPGRKDDFKLFEQKPQPRYQGRLVTEIEKGKDEGPFARSEDVV